MDTLVLEQVGSLPEALAAFGAVERLLARVHASVLLQARTANEALAAVVAHKGPLLRVSELVA